MEFLFGLVFCLIILFFVYRLFVSMIMWVCDPMVQYVEGKDARELKFMEKMEKHADVQKKKDSGNVPAVICTEAESPESSSETKRRWPRRFTDGDMN